MMNERIYDRSIIHRGKVSQMGIVYVVQIQYDPTLDYGCGVDMTTRDTLHIADSQQEAEEWLGNNTPNIAAHYEDVYPWDLLVVPWVVNGLWDDDKIRFAFDHD